MRPAWRGRRPDSRNRAEATSACSHEETWSRGLSTCCGPVSCSPGGDAVTGVLAAARIPDQDPPVHEILQVALRRRQGAFRQGHPLGCSQLALELPEKAIEHAALRFIEGRQGMVLPEFPQRRTPAAACSAASIAREKHAVNQSNRSVTSRSPFCVCSPRRSSPAARDGSGRRGCRSGRRSAPRAPRSCSPARAIRPEELLVPHGGRLAPEGLAPGGCD